MAPGVNGTTASGRHRRISIGQCQAGTRDRSNARLTPVVACRGRWQLDRNSNATSVPASMVRSERRIFNDKAAVADADKDWENTAAQSIASMRWHKRYNEEQVNAPVAQPDRALPFEGRGHRFEPRSEATIARCGDNDRNAQRPHPG